MGFLVDETDEGALVEAITMAGAVILPRASKTWPLPIIQPPLPPPLAMVAWQYSIWHPGIFSEEEMNDERNRNCGDGICGSGGWPVLHLLRSLPDKHSIYWGNLTVSVSPTSFRMFTNGRRTQVTDLTPAELADFSARGKELEKLYRRICLWMRKHFIGFRRAGWCGPSAHRWFDEWKDRLGLDGK
jgi:hypothetical protein